MSNEPLPNIVPREALLSSFKMPAGAQPGYALTTNSEGVSSWQEISSGDQTVSNPMKLGTPSVLQTVPKNITKIHQFGIHFVAIDSSDKMMYYTTDQFYATGWQAIRELRDCELLTSTTTLGFVCATDYNDVYHSMDGQTWTFLKHFEDTIRDILGVDDTLILVGDMTTRNGVQRPNLFTTVDGVTWTFREVATERQINKLRKIGNNIIALGNNGLFILATELDMSDATIVSADPNENETITGIAYDEINDVYTVVGTGNFLARTDPGDIETWNISSIPLSNPIDLVQINQLYISGDEWNYMLFSEDSGVTWHRFESIKNITYVNNIYLVTYNGQIWMGPNLLNLTIIWDSEGADIFDVTYSTFLETYIISYSSGQLIASETGAYGTWSTVGQFNGDVKKILSDEINEVLFVVGSNNVIFYTTDLISWTDITQQLTNVTHDFNDIIYVSSTNQYVAVGDTHLAYSTIDIDTWAEGVHVFQNAIISIATNGNNVVACGNSGGVYVTNNVSDVWIKQDLYTNGMDSVNSNIYFNKVIHDAPGERFILASENGDIWQSIADNGNEWRFISTNDADYESKFLGYHDGTYYALYDNNSYRNNLYISSNAIDWRKSIMNPHPINYSYISKVGNSIILSTESDGYTVVNSMNDIIYYGRDRIQTSIVLNEQLLAFDNLGGIYYSSDLENLYFSQTMLLDQNIRGAATDDNVIVLVGSRKIFVISIGEGIGCQQVFASAPSFTFRNVCYGNGAFIVYGSQGKIYRTIDQGSTWTTHNIPGDELYSMCYFQPEMKFYGMTRKGLLVMSDDAYDTYTTNTELQSLYSYSSARIAATSERMLVIDNSDYYALRPLVYNGTDWRVKTFPHFLSDDEFSRYLHVVNDMFVITCSYDIACSSDGTSWFFYSNNSDGGYYVGAHYMNNKYIFVGRNNCISIHTNLDYEV